MPTPSVTPMQPAEQTATTEANGIATAAALGAATATAFAQQQVNEAATARSLASTATAIANAKTTKQIFDEWEARTQVQRTEYERTVVGSLIRDKCIVEDVTKDREIRLDCNEGILRSTSLYKVPASLADRLSKGQVVTFVAKVTKLRVLLLNTLDLDWIIFE